MAYKFQLGAFTASGSLKTEGTLEAETSFTIGSAALTEAELEKIDGITNGVAAVDKALVLNGGKEIGGITALSASTVSGSRVNVALSNLYIDGTAVSSTAAELNVLDGINATTAELNLTDGNSSIGTTAVADGHGILMNHGGTMAQTTVQTLAAYLDDEITAMPNLVTVGTIGSGTWQGGVIASAYLDADTAHLSSTQTFSGAKTFSSAVDVTDATAASSTTTGALKVAGGISTQADLYVGDDIVMKSSEAMLAMGPQGEAQLIHNSKQDGLTLSMSGSEAAVFKVQNTNADSMGGGIAIEKSSSSPADNDQLGAITWWGFNDAEEEIPFAAIDVLSQDVSDSSEDGQIAFNVMIGGADTEMMDFNKTAAGATTMQEVVNIADHNGSTKGLKLNGTLITSTAAEINLLDTAAAGTVRNSKAVIYNGSGHIKSNGYILNNGTSIINSTGDIDANSLAVGGSSITATPAELNYLDNDDLSAARLAFLAAVTAGTAAADKALVLNANKDIGGINHVSASYVSASAGFFDDITVLASSIVIGDTTISETDIAYVDSITTGVAAASKALVLNGGKEIGGITALSASTVSGSRVNAAADSLYIDGVAVTSTAAELNLIDGSSAGVVVNSKGVVYGDSGEVNATTLQIGGTSISATAAELNAMCDVSIGGDHDDVAVAVGSDFIMFRDGGVTGATKFDSIVDLVAGIASTGLDAGSGQLSVDVSDFMSSGANNRILTATGTDAFQGEANFTFDGTDLALTGDFTITGDLTVTGTQTSINVTNLEVKDPLIGLGFQSGSNDAAAGDRGLIFGLDSEDDACFFWDESESQFALCTTDSALNATTVNVVKYADLQVNNLIGNVLKGINQCDNGEELKTGVNYFADLGGAESVKLPVDLTVGESYIIKAPSNCSSTNTITISVGDTTAQYIDGAPHVIMESPFAAVEIVCVASASLRIF